MNLRRTTSVLRSNGVTSRRGAFTLIELLVVVSIIALLMTLLMPALSGIRERAWTIQCATYERAMGVASLAFAGDNQGRLPGSGTYHRTGDVSGWSWRGLIAPYMPKPMQTHYDVRKYRIGEQLRKHNEIYCPALRKFDDSNYPRAYLFSTAARGGPDWSGNPWHGPDGLPIAPTPNLWPWTEYGNKVIRYHLGAPYSMSRRPAVQILVMETFAATDYFSQFSATPWIPLNPDDGLHPPWTGDIGRRGYAFRHSLTANTLFFDGHVERLAPQDDVRSKRRVLFHE